MLNKENYQQVVEFLKRIRGVLATGQFVIQKTAKNYEFSKKHDFSHQFKKDILMHLKPDDCVAIEPNNNPRYPNAEVYKFIKNCNLLIYGEELFVKLYIKMYLQEMKTRDYVVVISFHEEGMY